MIQRISRKKYRIFSFDTETHNDEESIAKGETSIWLACFIDEESLVTDESIYFYDMDSLIDHWETLVNPKRTRTYTPIRNVCTYVWNLSFEWSFLLPVLLKRGFKFKEVIEKDDEYVYNSVSTKTCSSVWQIQIKFSKKSGIFLLRDLAKVFSGSLKEVAKSFNLDTQKGEIDYRLNRLHGHVVTKEEKEYCFKDVRIIIDILLKMKEKEDRFFWNAISAASYSTKMMIQRGWPRSIKPYKKFREEYPVIDEQEEEAIFLRKTVRGGITYATKEWQFINIEQPIGHIDLHQAHPSSAFRHRFPYGRGEYYTGKPIAGKICACHIRISYDDVYLHSVISLIGLNFITDREIWIWDFELPTMKKAYVNLKIEFIDGYAYNHKPLVWRRYYEDNYNKRLAAKEHGDTFNVMFYKLLNNSSYGKLLERPHYQTFVNVVRDDGIIDSDIIDKPIEECPPCARYTYLPAGSCIPAFTRVTLIEGALKLCLYKDDDGVTRFHKNVIYFDSDSIFFILNEKTQKIWEEEFDREDHLGGWGWEETSQRGQFTAAKRYKIEHDGKAIIKAGGINFSAYIEERVEELIKERNLDLNYDEKKELIDNYELPYDEINIVSSVWKVRRAYRVKGGTIIEFQNKEMNIQDKYIEIAKRNLYNKDDH